MFARLFDAVLRVATTCMVGRFYRLSEDLGLTNFLGAFEGDALALARTALADTPASDQAAFRLHGAMLSLLHAIFRPGHPSCGGRHVTSLCFRKDVARAGRSLCGFLTCNVLLPSLRRTNSTGSRGSISPHGAGSSRFWRTRRSARTRRDGSRGCFTLRTSATLRPGQL